MPLLHCCSCSIRTRREPAAAASPAAVAAAVGVVYCCLQVTPTLALYDTMQYVRSPTATVCYGMCLGMGGFLLTAGGEKVGSQLRL